MSFNWITYIVCVWIVGMAAPVAGQDARAPEAVFGAFDAFVEQERTYRVASSLGGIAFGGALGGVGALVAAKTDSSYTPWAIASGVTAGLGLLALLVPSSAEQIARQAGGDPRALEAEWRALADKTETERVVGAVLGLVLGAAALGSGIAVMSGAGDLDRDDEALVGGLLLGAGTGFVIGGATSFFVQQPVERSFEQFQAARALEVSLGAGPSVFSLQARGTF